MADLRTYECTMCRVKCRIPEEMAVHVLREKEHRKMLAFYNPKGVKELARLQYFLDTHMKEEPILGLEYIVEEQLEPEKYRYTCQLCHQGGDPYTIFTHIMSKEHMQRYREKHHPSLPVKVVENPSIAYYLRELRARALAIQNERNCPVERAIPTLITERATRKGPTYKQATRKRGKRATRKRTPPPPVIQKLPRICPMCPICKVICDSTSTLCHHILGGRHLYMLWKVAPGDVKQMARMQYILDNYIKEDPVLGLEYVVEIRESESYRYTCSLCGVVADLSQSLFHVVGEDHMVRYISKHHSMMLPRRLPDKMEYVRELREIALTIQSRYGRKNIQTADSFVSCPSLTEEARPSLTEEVRTSPTEEVRTSPTEEVRTSPTEEVRTSPTEEVRTSPTEEIRTSPTEEARLSPTEEGRPSPTEEARPSPPADLSEESGTFLHDGEGLDNCRPCRLCNAVFPSPVDLWKHVMGRKHKEILSKTSPKDLKELGRLQYFLNNHMKKDPLLGLEYIVEEQVGSTSYKYTCQLCNVKGYLPQMISHISCVDHVERYIDKDHSDLSLRVYTYPERADYIRALTIIARVILDKCGRQDIVQY